MPFLFIYKAANQANSKLCCISYTGYVLAKEIVSLLCLQLMYSYLNELTLYLPAMAASNIQLLFLLLIYTAVSMCIFYLSQIHISAVKKGEAKKEQVTEWHKDVVISQKKAIPARLRI